MTKSVADMVDRQDAGDAEEALLAAADRMARAYVAGCAERRPFPNAGSLAGLAAFDEALPTAGRNGAETLALLDRAGSPATVASNGPNYYGFVIGASLPVAAAADRLVLAWDQSAALSDSSPAAAAIERVAARWLLDVLDLPRGSGVGFSTGATAGTITCLATARRTLLRRAGWDFDRDGLAGSPAIRVVLSRSTHIVVRKAVRLLGFGAGRVIEAPVDAFGRIDADALPPLDGRTILCLQAGDVATGEFDPFAAIVPRARAAGAWVHVDGAFGLWARASDRRALTDGIDGADSWTVDAHKWLNTPYDGAAAICRDAAAMAGTMNSDTVYIGSSQDAQKNLGLEFSRRPRGIAIWAALRTLGREGVAAMVDHHCGLATRLAERLRDAGFEMLNRVVLNQVLIRCATDEQTLSVRQKVIDAGAAWFGTTVWQNRPAIRISISSWRTADRHIDRLADALMAAMGD